MRYGFTTGSAAAAAAKAAAFMLLSGKEKTTVEIMTPKGILYNAKINNICLKENEASCSVTKDGGDDPDITDGMEIYAEVSFSDSDETEIKGGKGIGTVTKPGLDQPVGEAAINHVPRAMIRAAVSEVAEIFDHKGGFTVTISAPAGEELAAKTFNPKLGIEGGISIIGTSGIVEPMSSDALIETIRLELKQKRALGDENVIVAPGNYGQDYIKEHLGYDIDKSVKCSNFIGITIDMAAELGFKKFFMIGHIGKLIKLSGGIMNTHSKEGDCRMELMSAFALKAGADRETALKLLEQVSTEAAVGVLKEKNVLKETMELVMESIAFHMQKRAGCQMKTECLVFDNINGELGRTKGVNEWFTLQAREAGQKTL